MILSIFGQILGFTAITFFGFLITNLILSQANILEKISLGFLVGLGIFTFVVFLMNWLFGMPFTLYPVLTILLWLILLSGFLNFIFKRKFLSKINSIKSLSFLSFGNKPLSAFEKIIIFLIIFILFSVLINNLYWPVWMWDAISLYDYRAKNIVALGRIVGAFDVSSGTYPLLTSISHGVVYLFGGTNPQYLYFLFLLSLSIVFYFFMRRFVIRKYSLISLLFLLSIPVIIQQAQVTLTDLPQSAYLLPAFLYLVLGLFNSKKSPILFSGILFSLGTWVRNEPFWMVGFLVLIIFSFKRRWFVLDGFYYIITNSILYIWSNFIDSHQPAVISTSEVVKTDFFAKYSHTLLSLNYWTTIIVFIFNNVLLLMLPLYVVMFLLLLLKRNKLSKPVILMTFLICGIILFFAAGSASYILTTDYWPALYSSLRRIVIFLDALVVANISLLLFPSHD